MRTSQLAAAVAAATIAGSALAAGDTMSKRGLIYAWSDGGPPALLAEPKPDAPEVAHAPNGSRVRFVDVVGGATPTWYHVDQLGIASGWLDARQTRADAPPRPRGAPVPKLDLGDLTLHTATVLTSAARGLDARVRSFGSEPSRADSLQQLADLRSAVDHQMRDVPYTGQPPEKPGHVPGSRPNHTVQGRLEDAKRFRDGLTAEAAK